MTLDPEFWRDRFHLCALYAGKLAQSEDKLDDSEHVKRLAYELYEGGAFREETPETKEESIMTNLAPSGEAA